MLVRRHQWPCTHSPRGVGPVTQRLLSSRSRRPTPCACMPTPPGEDAGPSALDLLFLTSAPPARVRTND